MPNDTSTLNGSLLEMKDQLIYELGQKGVTASYSSSDGLLGLIGEISNIQTGGGDCTGLIELFTGKSNPSVTSVTIPSTVTSLRDRCFYNCTGLTSITMSNTVTSMGTYCFTNCTNLTSITMSNTLTSCGSACFQSCTGLTSITIPSSMTSLGSSCFNGCTNLSNIIFEGSTPPSTIETNCFYRVTATVTVPQGSLSAYQTALSGKGGTLTIVEAQ